MTPLLQWLRPRIPVRLRVGVVRRPLAHQLYVTLHRRSRWAGARVAMPEDARRRLEARDGTPGVKLNVGGGKGHEKTEGWTVVDLRDSAEVILDLTAQRLPFADGAVDVIFTSHTLEHIYPQRLHFVLTEFARVLHPAHGLVRIGVPDIELAIRAYQAQDYGFFLGGSEVTVADREAPIGGLLASWLYSTRRFDDPQLRHGEGHVHCFDEEHLAHWLRRAGFRCVWRSAYRQSALPELQGEAFDRHPNETLFMEAMR